MSRRSWLFSILKNDPELNLIHGGRVYQGSALRTAKVAKPFLVYHIGNETDEELAENATPSRNFFQIYAHDDFADFTRIDKMLARVKLLLVGQGSATEGIITTRYLETSQDLDDVELNTIFRYSRYQLILS